MGVAGHFASDKPFILIELLRIITGVGCTKWGAEEGKDYFILKLGQIFDVGNIK